MTKLAKKPRVYTSAYKGGDANKKDWRHYIDELEKLLAGGTPITHALPMVGLSKGTYYDWLGRGKAGDPEYQEFEGRMAVAKAAYTEILRERIERSRDWKAQAWLLERADPENYGSQEQHVTHTHIPLPPGTQVLDVAGELARRSQPQSLPASSTDRPESGSPPSSPEDD